MFNNYVSYEFDMPIADDSKETINAIYYQMQKVNIYMDHIKGQFILTCRFRDPLTPDLNATELLTSEMKIFTIQKSIDASALRHILNKKKGLNYCGISAPRS